MKISLEKKCYFILKISVTTACNLQHAELRVTLLLLAASHSQEFSSSNSQQ